MALEGHPSLRDDPPGDPDHLIPPREALGLGGVQAAFADQPLQRTPHFHLGEGSRIQHLVHGACHRPAHPGGAHFRHIALDQGTALDIGGRHYRRSSRMISESGLPGITSDSKSSSPSSAASRARRGGRASSNPSATICWCTRWYWYCS